MGGDIDKYKKLVQTMKAAINPEAPLPLFNALVKSVEGETCTVTIGSLELDDVRLKATINGSENKVLVTPKKDSYVLVGSLTGDLKDLAVMKIDEVEKLTYEQDGLKVEIDSVSKKISIKNENTSLKNIMQELSNLLKQFKVNTPSGPSTNILPDTLTAIVQFENHFNQLLN